MRLKLVAKSQMDDPAEKGWRLLERGELTLGRSPDCGWRLADPDRTLSKLHCRIVRDATGFLLRDESVNGVTVDGVELAEGQTVRLSDGSSVALGPYGFKVEITGEAEPDWSDPDPTLPLADDNLTVTSIIADVSPGGATATGRLPGRSGDEWLDLQAADPVGEREGARLRGQDAGWPGPPDLKLVSPALPDDWNAASDAASRSEHQIATTTRIRVAAAPLAPAEAAEPARPDPSVGDEAEAMVAAFLAGARMSPALPPDPARFMREMGRAVRAAADRLAVVEAASADFLTSQGLERERPQTSLDPASLAPRIDALGEDQRLLHEAARSVLDDVAQRFDPRAIEARVDAKASAGFVTARLQQTPFLAERAYWAAYREAWADGGGLRQPFRQALGGSSPSPAADDFEDLSSARGSA